MGMVRFVNPQELLGFRMVKEEDAQRYARTSSRQEASKEHESGFPLSVREESGSDTPWEWVPLAAGPPVQGAGGSIRKFLRSSDVHASTSSA